MEFNKRLNHFKYGFFTKKIDDLFYILYVNTGLSNTARFSMQSNIPDFINPNFDMRLTGMKIKRHKSHFC